MRVLWSLTLAAAAAAAATLVAVAKKGKSRPRQKKFTVGADECTADRLADVHSLACGASLDWVEEMVKFELAHRGRTDENLLEIVRFFLMDRLKEERAVTLLTTIIRNLRPEFHPKLLHSKWTLFGELGRLVGNGALDLKDLKHLWAELILRGWKPDKADIDVLWHGLCKSHDDAAAAFWSFAAVESS